MDAQYGVWQPIETAPKDGALILACVHPNRMFVWWQRADGKEPYESCAGNGAGWVDGTTDSFDDYCIYAPQHWMPLPEAPPSQPLA